jgi:hypothetical protein
MSSDDAKLVEILERDAANGGVVLGRGGKISVRHYATQLKCSTFIFKKKGYEKILDRYQVEVGASTNLETKLPAMRNWLEDKMQEGALGIRDGKIDRVEFCRVFGIKGGTFLVRSPKIRDMFDEFDARVAENSYQPKRLQEDLARLKVALAESCPLDKDGLTISKKHLATAVKITEAYLFRNPFHPFIVQKEEEIRADALRSRIWPLVEGRRYDFRGLVESWGQEFSERVAVGFTEIAPSMASSTRKRPYLTLIELLTFIGASASSDCRDVTSAAFRGSVIPQRQWENAVWEWRNAMEASVGPDRQVTTASQYIDTVRQILAKFASKRIFPDLRSHLSGIKNASRKGGKRASVAEAVAFDGDDSESVRRKSYIDFAAAQLSSAAKKFNFDIQAEESAAFLAVLDAEVERDSDLSPDPAQAILAIIDRRLNSIEKIATGIYHRWRAHHDDGERLALMANIDPEQFFETYFTLNTHAKGRALQPHFPVAGEVVTLEKLEIGIANLIKIAIVNYDGLMPDKGFVGRPKEFGQFFEKRYNSIRSKVEMDAYLSPHPDAIGAVITMYLCASGANISVGRTLHRDCVEPSDLAGHKRITGFKARAQGRPIIADLPSKCDAVKAVEWVASSGEFARSAANANITAKEDKDPLFAARISGTYKLPEPHWYTNWFKANIGSAEELNGLGLVPSMIRPSILLRAALENDGRLQMGQAIGQHSSQVTAGYQVKWPTRLLYDFRIKQFSDAFEALVTRNIEAAAEKLGIGAEEFAKRVSRLAQTGLGTFCSDPFGRPGSEGEKCKALDCWNDCPHLIVLAEVEAISLLQLWQHSLRLAQGDWERDQPARWDSVYLPWLCLTDVVEEKMRTGSARLVWKEAKALTDRRVADPNYPLPQPI